MSLKILIVTKDRGLSCAIQRAFSPAHHFVVVDRLSQLIEIEALIQSHLTVVDADMGKGAWMFARTLAEATKVAILVSPESAAQIPEHLDRKWSLIDKTDFGTSSGWDPGMIFDRLRLHYSDISYGKRWMASFWVVGNEFLAKVLEAAGHTVHRFNSSTSLWLYLPYQRVRPDFVVLNEAPSEEDFHRLVQFRVCFFLANESGKYNCPIYFRKENMHVNPIDGVDRTVSPLLFQPMFRKFQPAGAW